MIKVEVIEKFTLADYKKLKNVEKVMTREENEFGVGDTFECGEEMAKYLTGDNAFKKSFIKIIEVVPEVKEVKKKESKEEKETTKTKPKKRATKKEK